MGESGQFSHAGTIQSILSLPLLFGVIQYGFLVGQWVAHNAPANYFGTTVLNHGLEDHLKQASTVLYIIIQSLENGYFWYKQPKKILITMIVRSN